MLRRARRPRGFQGSWKLRRGRDCATSKPTAVALLLLHRKPTPTDTKHKDTRVGNYLVKKKLDQGELLEQMVPVRSPTKDKQQTCVPLGTIWGGAYTP